MLVSLYQSKGYALFLALLPVVLMYQVLGIGMGVSTVLVAIGMAYAAIVIVNRSQYLQLKPLYPLIIYFIYTMTKSNITNILLAISIVFHMLAISTGVVNAAYLKKVLVKISIVAAVGTILQFVVHLIFGIHIPMIINSLCLDDLYYYSKAILTGVGRNSTMYRPSAFFLEPAHLTLYCIIGLMISLYKDEPDYKRSILISIGILATTSGMGIVLTAALWALFPFVTTKGLSLDKIKRIIFLGVIALVAIVLLSRMSFFQAALARITGPVAYSSTQYNAIWGRTAKWDEYIATMSDSDLIWGFGNYQLPDAYFTGLMTLIYSYGIVGTVLFYIALATLALNCKDVIGRTLVIIYAVMLTLADIAGFINVIFYCGCVLTFLIDKKEEAVNAC